MKLVCRFQGAESEWGLVPRALPSAQVGLGVWPTDRSEISHLRFQREAIQGAKGQMDVKDRRDGVG